MTALPEQACFIGLGAMGGPMAGHLLQHQRLSAVANRGIPRLQAWQTKHSQAKDLHISQDLSTAASKQSMLITCLGNDDSVRACAEQCLDVLTPGAVWVDHTTTSAKLAEELYAEARQRGLHFVDAPVSGGQIGAEQGKLSIMCGGDAEAMTKARPFLDCYAKLVRHIGPAGSGQRTKMVNQICIAGLLQGLAEALAFAGRAGLKLDDFLPVIQGGAAQSWQMDHRAQTMWENRFDFGFAVDWMRKDLGLVLDEAKRNGATLPVTALVDQFYAELQAQHDGRCDTSALIKRLKTTP